VQPYQTRPEIRLRFYIGTYLDMSVLYWPTFVQLSGSLKMAFDLYICTFYVLPYPS
jgi:hypothetical protein